MYRESFAITEGARLIQTRAATGDRPYRAACRGRPPCLPLDPVPAQGLPVKPRLASSKLRENG
jgi:hypothetical protein